MSLFLILLLIVAIGAICQAFWRDFLARRANPFLGLPQERPVAVLSFQNAVKGKGAKVWLFDPAATPTPALVQLGEINSVTPPQRTRDTVDTTHHGSVGDYREFVSNLIDAGEVTFTMNWVPGTATDTLLNSAFAAGDIRTFAVDVNKPTGQQRLSGSCIVTGFEPDEIGIEDKQTASVTFKVSGPITFATAP